MSRRAWVVGSSGLLGRAMTRALHANREVDLVIAEPLPWSDPVAFDEQTTLLLARLLEEESPPWTIYWCAGTGTVGTSQESLDAEQALFERFLGAVAERLGGEHARGSFFFASSAGGVYAGSAAPPFDETTTPAPISAYGRAKLAAENAMKEFAEKSGVPVLIGRIANLYGPDQNLSKAQGVISQLCRSSITRVPTSIYVSLDTIRDYIHVDDCAGLILDAMARLAAERGVVTKVLASHQPVTIGAILGLFRSMSQLRLFSTIGSSANSALQVRDLRLDSVVWPELDERALTPLVVGIDSIARRMMMSNAQGQLR